MLRTDLPSLIIIASCFAFGCSLNRVPIDDGQSHEFGTAGALGSTEMEGQTEADAPGQSSSQDTVAAEGDFVGNEVVVDDAGISAVIDVERVDDVDGADDVSVLPQERLRYQGACGADEDCESDEVCIASQGVRGRASYCASACQADTDCAPGPDGAGSPACARMDDGGGRCHLPCDALTRTGCPDPMICRDQLLFLATGSCVFDE